MESLRTYLKDKTLPEQQTFAERCGTTIGYLRKVLSTGQQLGAEIVIAIERESSGAVSAEELRPDINWKYLRAPAKRSSAAGARRN